MGEQYLLDFGEEIALGGETSEPKETVSEKEAERTEENRPESIEDQKEDPIERPEESSDESAGGLRGPTEQRGDTSSDERSGSESAEGKPKRVRKSEPRPSGSSEAGSVSGDEIRPDGWHTNIIGNPKGHPNPYFQGLVVRNDNRQHLIAYKDIHHASRVIYVEDIHVENAVIITKKFFIHGPFPEVIVSLTEEEFEAVRAHKQVKLKTIHYSHVSCERERRRNYQIKEDRWPTPAEIKQMDKHMDDVDYALMSYAEREEMKKTGFKAPVIEEVPVHIPEETPQEVEETEEEVLEEAI